MNPRGAAEEGKPTESFTSAWCNFPPSSSHPLHVIGLFVAYRAAISLASIKPPQIRTVEVKHRFRDKDPPLRFPSTCPPALRVCKRVQVGGLREQCGRETGRTSINHHTAAGFN